MNKQIDLAKIERELQFMFNAVDVDIDAEGIFASFIWDEFDTRRYEVIANYLWSHGLKEVDYQILDADSSIVIYGFYEEFNDELGQTENALVSEEVEVLDERKTVIKVNAKGARRRKVVCGTGKKWDGKRCVAMSSTQKLSIRKGKIKAKRTNKTKGASKKRRTATLRKKALKRRSQQGLK